MIVATMLLVGACSSPPDRAAPAATPTPTPTPSASASTPRADASIVDDRAVPAPGAQKTFRDWTVACDNVRRCAMTSLGTESDFPRVTMRVTRGAGPAGVVEIALDAPQGDVPAPATVLIDDRRFAVAGNGLSGDAAAAIARALANARSIAVLGAGDRRIGTISPAGASAALRYIDAQQGRAGNVTALVARGEGAAATVPPAPPLPRIHAVAFAGKPVPITPALLRSMMRTGQCDAPMAGQTPRAHALADGATLVLLPCSSGAYNEIDALFVIRDGKAQPAQVDSPSGFEETGADSRTPVHSVINGDVEGGVLHSFAKGRGLGDCGVMQDFVWDGARLRLAEQRAMGECRGNPDYLTVWRARIERG